MIKMTVHNPKTHSFSVSGDEPFTVVHATRNGHVLAYVYPGSDIDEYAEPIGCYDSHVPIEELAGGWVWSAEAALRKTLERQMEAIRDVLNTAVPDPESAGAEALERYLEKTEDVVRALRVLKDEGRL